MEINSTVLTILEIASSAFAASWLTRIVTIRSRVRQEGANAKQAEAQADKDYIENIRKTMDDVYKPIIDDLKDQVSELRQEVLTVKTENERLKAENNELRKAIREISPDSIPSAKSYKASQQPRDGRSGRFVKSEPNEEEN